MELVEEGAQLLRTNHPNVDEQITELEQMAHEAVNYEIDIGSSAPHFVEKLCDDQSFLLKFAEYLISNESTLLGHLMSVVIRRLRGTNVIEYRGIAQAAACHCNVLVAHGTANAISYGGTLNSPLPEDVEIVSELSKHPHAGVRRVTLDGIGVLGKTSAYSAIAIRLLLEIEIGVEPKLADAMCGAMDHGHINPEVLSGDQVKALLGKMVPVPSLDEYHIGTFLDWATRKYPEAVFDFVLHRLEHSRHLTEKSTGGTSYRPVPFQDVGTHFQGLRQSESYAHFLQEVCSLLQQVQDAERFWLWELFWAIGTEDVTTLSALDHLLHAGDSRSHEILLELLSKAPPEFSLSCPFFDVHVVEICAEGGEELLNEALSTLVTNTHVGIWSSTPGQAPPKFVSVRDRACRFEAAFQPGTPAHLMFVQIRESADRAIRDKLNQDAEFDLR
jgi:hypothetical protein